MRRATLLSTVLLGALASWPALAAEAPRVVATIAPVQAIAAAVMQGVGTPAGLLEPGASPHAYSLRPSQAMALQEAHLILWVGEGLETFLVKPLQSLGGGARQLELAEVDGMALLPYRDATMFAPPAAHAGHEHDHEHEHDGHAQGDAHDHDHADDHAHDHDGMDPHVWLSPANARVMAGAIAATLAEIDPAHSEAYAANAAAFGRSLDALEVAIGQTLAPVRGRPFIVFHDAYQYFERHFDLPAAAAIHVVPDVPPGAARLAEIQAQLGALGAACVFAEPQFEPRVVRTVVEGSDARTGTLDPLGAATGTEGYAELLTDLAQSLADCLAD